VLSVFRFLSQDAQVVIGAVSACIVEFHQRINSRENRACGLCGLRVVVSGNSSALPYAYLHVPPLLAGP
jgi:hypothetical protein